MPSIPFASHVNTKPKFLLFGRNTLQTGLRQLWVAPNSQVSSAAWGMLLCPLISVAQVKSGSTHRVWDQISLSRMAAVVIVPV